MGSWGRVAGSTMNGTESFWEHSPLRSCSISKDGQIWVQVLTFVDYMTGGKLLGLFEPLIKWGKCLQPRNEVERIKWGNAAFNSAFWSQRQKQMSPQEKTRILWNVLFNNFENRYGDKAYVGWFQLCKASYWDLRHTISVSIQTHHSINLQSILSRERKDRFCQNI